jgi:hypothetical protein
LRDWPGLPLSEIDTAPTFDVVKGQAFHPVACMWSTRLASPVTTSAGSCNTELRPSASRRGREYRLVASTERRARRRRGPGRTGLHGLGRAAGSWHRPALAMIIPIGDMLLVLASNGSTKSAFGIHGFTMVLMLVASVR